MVTTIHSGLPTLVFQLWSSILNTTHGDSSSLMLLHLDHLTIITTIHSDDHPHWPSTLAIPLDHYDNHDHTTHRDHRPSYDNHRTTNRYSTSAVQHTPTLRITYRDNSSPSRPSTLGLPHTYHLLCLPSSIVTVVQSTIVTIFVHRDQYLSIDHLAINHLPINHCDYLRPS
ncbi:hypothetical protein N7519_010809 [Penicillium mononematosum]|uniref:uncharacterized protein n=1 Tax=Penicillium mononematosum TaxID=268346 RepID=UPI002547D273|nr:uncharacterized protein N7519_010809 [Penicillium mononematosum]KAJ6180348.1 hypothetical protein N7519_010809 [Penicillium mononematosum]